MATLEERVATLEAAMLSAQTEILKRAKSFEVVTIDSGRETAQLNTDADVTALTERVLRLEQALTVVNTTLNNVIRKDTNGEITEDVIFADSTVGPVVVSADSTEYRIIVANDGTLSTEVV